MVRVRQLPPRAHAVQGRRGCSQCRAAGGLGEARSVSAVPALRKTTAGRTAQLRSCCLPSRSSAQIRHACLIAYALLQTFCPESTVSQCPLRNAAAASTCPHRLRRRTARTTRVANHGAHVLLQMSGPRFA